MQGKDVLLTRSGDAGFMHAVIELCDEVLSVPGMAAMLLAAAPWQDDAHREALLAREVSRVVRPDVVSQSFLPGPHDV